MATNAILLKNLFAGYNQFDLLSTVNIALTGVAASTPVDGVVMTDGMKVVLSAQTDATTIGIYDCAVATGNYTLSLNTSLSTTTTFNKKAPFLFRISQGTSNVGNWNFYFTIGGAIEFTNISDSAIQHEQKDSSSIATLAAGDNTEVTVTFDNTYTTIYSVSAVAYKDGADYNISLFDKTAAADLLTERVYNVTNLAGTPATAFVIRVNVSGL